MEIIILGLVVLIIIIGKIMSMRKPKKDKSNINFDEFDDVENIKKQELHEKMEIEHETKVLNQVYNESFGKSIMNSLANKQENEELNVIDLLKAQGEALQNSDKARRDLENFRVLDSVESKEENVKEGNQITLLRENGYNFDVELFKKWSRQIFGCIKSGTDEQLQIVKNFISEELYGKFEKQIKDFARDGLEFKTDDLFIEKCFLYDYARSLSKEEIKILIQASMIEYILQKETNAVLRGDKNKPHTKKIIMTFVKQNKDEQEGLIHNCPNCGAEVIQTEFGKCRYCNTLVIPIRYNWTLANFETM